MSNNGRDAEERECLRLIRLAVLEGFLLATYALRHWVISKLWIDPSPLEEWIFKSFFLSAEILTAVGTLEAIFRMVFFINKANTVRPFPPHLPWWCGR